MYKYIHIYTYIYLYIYYIYIYVYIYININIKNVKSVKFVESLILEALKYHLELGLTTIEVRKEILKKEKR